MLIAIEKLPLSLTTKLRTILSFQSIYLSAWKIFVSNHKLANLYALLWWIRTNVVVFFAYCCGIFRTVGDKHYFSGLFCLMWWVIVLGVVVYFCILWWISTTVMSYYA